jgi:heme oxygenase (biliverdin-producing, ferredoxin)
MVLPFPDILSYRQSVVKPAAERSTVPTTIDDVAAVPFSQQLRDATAEAHHAAERAPFVADLLEGRLPQDDLARLAVQLHAVYGVLEEAVEAATDPAITPLLRRELDRTPALASDLRHLAGPDWATTATVLPATEAYCDRLRDVCFTWSGGLVAHHYTRYLGDLSGGQVLGRILQRVYDLPDGAGTAAYRFDDIASPKRFKDDYRALLDALPYDTEERARIAAEANVAFDCSRAVFDDLSRTRVSTYG